MKELALEPKARSEVSGGQAEHKCTGHEMRGDEMSISQYAMKNKKKQEAA